MNDRARFDRQAPAAALDLDPTASRLADFEGKPGVENPCAVDLGQPAEVACEPVVPEQRQRARALHARRSQRS